jgi:RNA polymerase sigma-54 factor
MFQVTNPSIRPLTTAHLAQTMTLLSLTAEELRQQIDHELASNPALELLEERCCPMCHRPLPPHGPCPVCSQPATQEIGEPVVFISPREDFYTSGGQASEEADEVDDPYSSSTEELPAYVLRQIAPDLEGLDRRIAAFLLSHLSEDGLLTIELVEAAFYFHVPLARVEAVQRIIQRADPLGVGSSTTQQAMLVQLEVLAEPCPITDLARRAIQEGMELLSRRQYTDLARFLKAPLRQVQAAVKYISENLYPFPGRPSWGDIRQPGAVNVQVYQRPDIIIGFQNEDPQKPLFVEIIMPLSGTLRVNPLFKQAIQKASDEKRDDWRADLERASLFVKCIQQRNHTMTRLMQRVVSLQKDFIIQGEKFMKPVTRARLSVELDVHESTISRAVASKTVQLPNRKIVPLSEFFDRSLNIRSVLKDIIIQESHPLSDMELVEILQKQGINVARRTVAKYRSMEGILPAHLRRPAC